MKRMTKNKKAISKTILSSSKGNNFSDINNKHRIRSKQLKEHCSILDISFLQRYLTSSCAAVTKYYMKVKDIQRADTNRLTTTVPNE